MGGTVIPGHSLRHTIMGTQHKVTDTFTICLTGVVTSSNTTSVSQALEAARRGGESREEVQAVPSLPLLLIS